MSSESPPKFRCADCGASFSRREHLLRHRKSHTKEKSFACTHCGKAFARMDVLAKHTASHEEAAQSPAALRGYRACRQCASNRNRCSKGQPCKRCADRGFRCVYPPVRKQGAANGDDDGSRSVDAPGAQPVHVVEQPSSDGLSRGALDSTFYPQMLVNNGQMGFDAGMVAPDAGGFAVNWLSPTEPTQIDWINQVTSFQASQEIVSDASTAFGFPFLQEGIDAGESWPWPASTTTATVSNITALQTIPTPALERNISDLEVLADAATTQQTVSPSSTVPTLYVDGDDARAPFRGRSLHQSSSIGNIRTDNDVSVTSPHTVAAPGLSLSAPHVLSLETYHNIINQMKAAPFSGELASFQWESFPSLQQMQTYFHLYWIHFHNSLPFLPPPFHIVKKPEQWLLVLAVSAIGSQYSPNKHSINASVVLPEVLQIVITYYINNSQLDTSPGLWHREQQSAEGEFEWPLALLQAASLNLILKAHDVQKGDQRGFCYEMYHMVRLCRSLRLLSGGRMAGDGDDAWIVRETSLRTGYLTWLLDCMFVFEFCTEPLMSLSEIQCLMPCRKGLWPPKGTTLPSFGDDSDTAITFRDALEMLFIEKKLPPDIDDYGTTILIYAIIQRMKLTTRHYDTALSSYCPSANMQARPETSQPVGETWPPSLTVLSRWRNCACDCLDILHWQETSISAVAGGWEPHTIFHLHLSRLLLLTPTNSLQILASAASVSRGSLTSGHSQRTNAARNQILRWAIEDQCKARLAVIHAGAVFWHVRRYSINDFLEPFGVFIATLVLWAYSTSVQFATQASKVSNGQDRPNESEQAQQQQQQTPAQDASTSIMSSEDDAEPFPFYIDRPCDDEIVQSYVRYGQKMSARLSHVGDLCRSGAPGKILRQGRRIMEKWRSPPTGIDTDEAPSAWPWGISAIFYGMLRDLEQVPGGERDMGDKRAAVTA